MECKITSIKPRRNAGFTLVELLVTVAISSVVLLVLAQVAMYTSRSFAALANYVDLDQYSRKTLDLMSQEIRQADRLSSFTTNQLVFNNNGGTNNLSYTYNPETRRLTRNNNSEVKDLLKECDSVSFLVYGRNTVSNSFDQFPSTNAAGAKLIKVNWTCSRQIFGRKVNTESMQSSKTVLRKP